jgi:GNAT superfamily N-acetyltransferase
MTDQVQLKIDNESVTIRRAAAGEIIDLRYRVLRPGWPRDAAVFDGDDLPTNYHFGAFADSPPHANVCCVTFHLNSWKDRAAWQLRGMATDPAWTGRGLGRNAVQLGITTIIAASPVHFFWCNARLAAVPFYEKLGWQIASERFEIANVGPHYQMTFAPRP